MAETDRPFPEALNGLLKEHEISQRELVRRVRRRGWGSVLGINQLARGELAPTPVAMANIANALQIDPHYFAEFRLAQARNKLDPDKVGQDAALANLRKKPNKETRSQTHVNRGSAFD